MENNTLTVEGVTAFAQVPRWLIRHESLSPGAKALYADVMSYADNTTLTAFPGRETLAKDLGVSVRTIGGYLRELEEAGALSVTRRRNKRTGNFYSNHYSLAFKSPWAKNDTRREEENDPITKTPSLTKTTNYLPTPPSFDEEVNLAHPRSRSHSDTATSPHMRAREICHQIHQQDAWDLESSLWHELVDELNHLVGQGSDIAHTLFNQGWFESLYRATGESKTVGLGIATWVSKIVAYERQQPHVARHASKPAIDPWQV